MSSESKKIIFFIVEGVSDENALHPILAKYYNDRNLKFKVVHGDITQTSTETTVVNKIKDRINNECKRYGLRPSDISNIIQLTDTDGVFIDRSHVIYGKNKKIHYTGDFIQTREVDAILKRNSNKRGVLIKLANKECISWRRCSVDYKIYYFSRNLEHVLHDIIETISDEEKTRLSNDFSDKYIGDMSRFKKYMCESEVSVKGSYMDTWEFISKGTNSLKRYSNFNRLFEDI